MSARDQMPETSNSRASVRDRDGGWRDRRDRRDALERIGVFEAMRWHWLTVVILVLVFAGAGVAVGLKRNPTYTAESRLQVQIVAHTQTALPGAISSSQTLASSYARQIDSTAVQRHLIRLSGEPASAADQVSASPIQDTNVVTVSATSASSPEAVKLANSGAQALHRYVAGLGNSGQANAAIQHQTYAAIREYQHRLNVQDRAQRQARGAHSPEARAAVRQAEFQTQIALMNRTALESAYGQTLQSYTPPLKPLSEATGASSDRTSMMQIFGLIGALAGLAAGAALVTWRANRLVRGSWEE